LQSLVARVCIDLNVMALESAMRRPIGPGAVAHALGAGPLIQFFPEWSKEVAAQGRGQEDGRIALQP
jgi:uncharacterized membrane protein YczE